MRPHAASELVDRARDLGLVERLRDPGDARKVHLYITDMGRTALEELAAVHLAELRGLAAYLDPLAER